MSDLSKLNNDGPQSPVPATDPVMIAWEAYKQSPAYANSRKWALLEMTERPIPPDIYRNIAEWYGHKGKNISKWWPSPQPMLDGRRTCDCSDDEIRRMVTQLNDGAYL